MKIDFTKAEYRDLIDMVYIAEWIMNAHKVKDDTRTKRYSKLEQKILSYAEKMGFSHLVEYAPEHDKYFPTRMFEEASSVHGFIDDYDNDSFWEELINRLAERDLIRQEGGLSTVLRLSVEERLEKQFRLEEKYAVEFEENGLENIRIDQDGD
jgi:ribosomal protein S8